MKIFLLLLVLVFVGLILFVGMIALVFSLGYVKCGNFVDKDTMEVAGCGVHKMKDISIGEVTNQKYVASGVVEKVTTNTKDVFVTLKVPVGENMFYRMSVRMVPTQDGSYTVSEERRKWLGYYDNDLVTTYSRNETNKLNSGLKGKEVMVMAVLPIEDSQVKKWQSLTNQKADILNKLVLIVKGLLNMNAVDAYQVGY